MGKPVCIYIYIYAYYIHYICVYICVCFTRGKFSSAVLNLSTGCFAVYAKRIRLISLKKIASYL